MNYVYDVRLCLADEKWIGQTELDAAQGQFGHIPPFQIKIQSLSRICKTKILQNLQNNLFLNFSLSANKYLLYEGFKKMYK